MRVRVRVLSVVVFLDLIECIAVYRDFTVIMIPTTGINISDIRCFYKLEPRSFAVMFVRVVVFLKFCCEQIPCPRRREFDVIVVMVTVIDSTIAGACHLFFTGTLARPCLFFIALFLCSESNFIAECDDFRDEKFRFKRVKWVAWVIFSIEGHGFYSILRRDIVDPDVGLRGNHIFVSE